VALPPSAAAGSAAASQASGLGGYSVSAAELSALKAEQARLQDEIATLRAWAQRVAADLGVPAP
jgi:hypothetical protein